MRPGQRTFLSDNKEDRHIFVCFFYVCDLQVLCLHYVIITVIVRRITPTIQKTAGKQHSFYNAYHRGNAMSFHNIAVTE